MKSSIANVAAFLLAVSKAAILPKRDVQGTATVNLAVSNDVADALGSGFIYGFPDNGTSVSTAIPDHFLTDIRFQTGRAGGAQTDSDGWMNSGRAGYTGRFDSTLSNYRTARKFGAQFIMLPHDMWGAQGGMSETDLHPGDNGDWTEMERFLDQLISDMQANDMLDGVIIDLWNEPDLDGFWHRSWDQYLEYIGRAHKIFKAQLPWNSINIYSWHQIGAWEREPDTTIPALNQLKEEYDLPWRPVHVNEYAWPDEKQPATSAWYISQLERHDIRGLRANWEGGSNLHNFMGNLIANNGEYYYPNGDYRLYEYYGYMKGTRAATTASSDLLFDVFAVKGDFVKIIAGTRLTTNTYNISITGLDSVGFPQSGNIGVRTLRFDWAGTTGEVGPPVDLGVQVYAYSNGQLTLTVNPPDTNTAYAFEF
ncbi:glycoside hydrolase superfamily [Ilyonectria robusta]|uniref:glycoside hydrolase superfamily n=1 Tax=Ilyonectria robusta TaxID=1079257 RepID=UPI001E8ED8D8|nr:glycoside hydrolase superfamily [Ilyonectria robusta]KAH8672313.1 glycoside hydrolase superfamily [Ilyonectria robusta]